MRSELFHPKGQKPSALVVDEATRLTVQGTEPVHVFALDDNGKKSKLLTSGTHLKVKLHDVEEIYMESKGDFNSIIEGPDKLDNTPIEVAVEKPLTQTQQLRMWIQNEENLKNYSRQELKWEDFKDLGNMDDGDEFYNQFNQGMTKYEMQAEALRQETNPNRGNPISDEIEKKEAKKHVESTTSTDTQNNADTVDNSSTGHTHDKSE